MGVIGGFQFSSMKALRQGTSFPPGQRLPAVCTVAILPKGQILGYPPYLDLGKMVKPFVYSKPLPEEVAKANLSILSKHWLQLLQMPTQHAVQPGG